MHIMPTNHRPDLVMVRGAGSFLFDREGRRYLDFVQGWAVNALGHCPEEIAAALSAQCRTLLTPSPAYHNDAAGALAERLAQAAGLDYVFLASSGAEANECAVKLARKWGRTQKRGAHEIITTTGSFHGRTLALMSASGKPGWDDMFPPRMEGFVKVPYGDIDAMRAAVTPRTAAILVEPIQGEAGVIVPPMGYLRALRALADETGTLLVFDEVQTGMGRTGTLFRFETEGARPDVLVLGKGLGGGVPLAAVVASRAASRLEPGEHGGTYAGNAGMAAVGNAVFDVVAQPTFLAGVRQRAELLRSTLEQLRQSRPDRFAEVRGAGLLVAIGLVEPEAERIAERAREHGLLVNAPRPNTLRLMPSLRVSAAEIAEMGTLLALASS
jgi:acetylornithine/N-succinyldiaminopimelate aminotransferase